MSRAEHKALRFCLEVMAKQHPDEVIRELARRQHRDLEVERMIALLEPPARPRYRPYEKPWVIRLLWRFLPASIKTRYIANSILGREN